MPHKQQHPEVGVGVIIPNPEGEILIIKRTGFLPKYALPGGHVEIGETFEDAAIREMKEELDIKIINPKVVAVTNNLETHRETGRHYISIILAAAGFFGTPEIMEFDKISRILWRSPEKLPKPFFDASRLGVRCFITGKFYCQGGKR